MVELLTIYLRVFFIYNESVHDKKWVIMNGGYSIGKAVDIEIRSINFTTLFK